MFLLAVTSGEGIKVSYRILINLYTYTLVIMVGLLVAGGLLYLRWRQGRGGSQTFAALTRTRSTE